MAIIAATRFIGAGHAGDLIETFDNFEAAIRDAATDCPDRDGLEGFIEMKIHELRKLIGGAFDGPPPEAASRRRRLADAQTSAAFQRVELEMQSAVRARVAFAGDAMHVPACEPCIKLARKGAPTGGKYHGDYATVNDRRRCVGCGTADPYRRDLQDASEAAPMSAAGRALRTCHEIGVITETEMFAEGFTIAVRQCSRSGGDAVKIEAAVQLLASCIPGRLADLEGAALLAAAMLHASHPSGVEMRDVVRLCGDAVRAADRTEADE